jgi:hypothetical protein
MKDKVTITISVLSVVFSGCALYQSCRSIREARDANKIAKEAQYLSLKVGEPYMSIVDFEFPKNNAVDVFFKNFGQRAAYNFRLRFCLVCRNRVHKVENVNVVDVITPNERHRMRFHDIAIAKEWFPCFLVFAFSYRDDLASKSIHQCAFQSWINDESRLQPVRATPEMAKKALEIAKEDLLTNGFSCPEPISG